MDNDVVELNNEHQQHNNSRQYTYNYHKVNFFNRNQASMASDYNESQN